MTTESDDLHDFLADSDKLIKAGELSLKRMEKVRQALGLQAGASTEFLKHIPEGSDKNQQARKELNKMIGETDLSTDPTPSSAKRKKDNKRSKLAKAMNRKLRI